ncbi:MAG: excinuclease ABC subunit UvrA [Deltaproteobacteria bacterium]|nr:excinuclease ABC subunit UvrA [Deltaproteobacteria bacterium]
METIRIRGARQHNLKNIDVDIPRNKFVVITGVSGSGKSSLAFDTLYAEGRRRYIESLSAYARQFLDQRAKPDVDLIEGLSPAIAIEQRNSSSSPRSTVGTATEIADFLRVLYARVGTPFCLECQRPIVRHSVPQIVDQILNLSEGSRVQVLAPIQLKQAVNFSGVLRELRSAGFVRARVDGVIVDLNENIPQPRKSVVALEVVVDRLIVKSGIARRLADSLETAFRHGHDVTKLLVGDSDEWLFTQQLICPACGFAYPELTPAFFSPNSPAGACSECDGLGVHAAKKTTKKKKIVSSEDEKPETAATVCAACQGTKLKRESRGVRIQDRDLTQVLALSVAEAHAFFQTVSFAKQQEMIAGPLLQEIRTRFQFLLDVGLDYLTLARPTATLSGGEAQRIRLATQIGSGLSGVLYVLDEPSIGLHPRDTARLLRALFALRDRGNSVVVVEHDRETMLAADYVIDLGPGAGEHGGELLAAGTPEEMMDAPLSITGAYLRGAQTLPTLKRRRAVKSWLNVSQVALHNLNNVSVSIPLGVFTCVSGVSGSGKSTLVMDVLAPALAQLLKAPPLPKGGLPSAKGGTRENFSVGIPGRFSGWKQLDKIICVDQAAIGRTAHSNPATYIGLFNPLRELFAQTQEARVRGYGPERFSFNVKGGRCEACEGNGVVAVEMHFLPDLQVTCEVCRGARYNRETLEVQFRGRNIAQILDLTVSQALAVLGDMPAIRPRLETLRDVGLDYLRLGQPAPTLSGGEAQRLKLAKELSRRTSGHTLYILDEPTTGLHFADIERLLQVLNLLVDAGNSVLVIEHNLDVIQTADYLIELGPEGGAQGGQIVAVGTPEEVARVEQSHTGRFLRALLSDEETTVSPGVQPIFTALRSNDSSGVSRK